MVQDDEAIEGLGVTTGILVALVFKVHDYHCSFMSSVKLIMIGTKVTMDFLPLSRLILSYIPKTSATM